MLLKDKNAIIYGAGGAIGGGVARTFAREGANVFLVGRTQAKLEAVAKDIAAAGGSAEVAVVDALDERAVDEHAREVAEKAGSIDVSSTSSRAGTCRGYRWSRRLQRTSSVPSSPGSRRTSSPRGRRRAA